MFSVPLRVLRGQNGVLRVASRGFADESSQMFSVSSVDN